MKKALVIAGCVVGIASFSPLKADFFDNFFNNEIRFSGFAYNGIKEEGDSYILEFLLPKFKKSEVKVEIFKNNRTLRITARREQKEQSNDEKSSSSSRIHNSVGGVYNFPGTVDRNKTVCSLEDGVLTIKAPKLEMVEEDIYVLPIN